MSAIRLSSQSHTHNAVLIICSLANSFMKVWMILIETLTMICSSLNQYHQHALHPSHIFVIYTNVMEWIIVIVATLTKCAKICRKPLSLGVINTLMMISLCFRCDVPHEPHCGKCFFRADTSHYSSELWTFRFLPTLMQPTPFMCASFERLDAIQIKL